jgi:glycosyltransferase involved in cell wall biosynthesis
MGGGERHAGMIAQVLSEDGAEVELIGHDEGVDVDQLAARLGLDLSRCRLVALPDHGEAALGRHAAAYDLFVNATYMSRVAPESKRAAYLCFFPTPFDHDLDRWRKAAVRTIGPRLRRRAHDLSLGFGRGWFPPEGGRRRTWVWTSGDGVLAIGPGGDRALAADFARVGRTESTIVDVVDEHGSTLDRFEVSGTFRRREIPLPASQSGIELHIRSDTFVPSGTDLRTLGVAVSKLRISGPKSAATRLAARFPWLLTDPTDVRFLESYDVVLANSSYTGGWIERLWHRPAEILYPPIDTQDIRPAPERTKTILAVGRFFAPGLGHAKRQLEMVRFFGQAWREGRLEGWSFVLVGGCEDSQRPYLRAVEEAAAGLPVVIHANAPRNLVHELMSTASVFWSATGYGESEEDSPWAHEHFGMTTAEAMAGGCVPVVIDRAGQREIVREGVDGFRWQTVDQLLARTVQVAGDDELRSRLAASAVLRAQEFSDAAFAKRLRELVAEYDLLGAP